MKNKKAFPTPERVGTVYGGTILRTRRYAVYNLVTELISAGAYGCDKAMPITYATDKGGQYLGNAKMARFLTHRKGISVFEKQTPASSVCSIGYNVQQKKYYGWSHRAIHGFKTRREAARFASSVS